MLRHALSIRAVWLAALILLIASEAHAQRTLSEYRYFRALSIDLVGRPPTRSEIAEFEKPSFQLERWLDAHLSGPRYVERIRRIYTDLLRLELPENSGVFRPASILLRRIRIQGPDGKPIDLYFRNGQRRANTAIDTRVCFTADELGLEVPPDGPPKGTPKSIDRRLLAARTVLVKPWWLFADYRSAEPRDRAGPGWVARFGYELLWSMFTEPDGKTPTTSVRVCREEAQTSDTGRVDATGQSSKGSRHVSCRTDDGFRHSSECGCGIGLERCLPTAPSGFVMPWEVPLGVSQPFTSAPRPAILWLRAWWSEEPVRFIDRILRENRDFREVLTSPATVINGPLGQFYRFFANASCCGQGAERGYNEPEPLFDPAAVPATLSIHAVSTWTTVENRGPHSAGILTMPIFLLKYGSRRQRAHAIYTAFTCRDLVAEHVTLEPSNERDLTKREGCSSCHRQLEPMAAYFARIRESDWTYLPAKQFPLSPPECATSPNRMSPACRTFYDPEFTDAHGTILRGAYARPANADAGPRSFAKEITSSPEFAPCVVRRVAGSLLGRPITGVDDEWVLPLARSFATNGFRMRALVRALVTSPQYRDANDAAQVGR